MTKSYKGFIIVLLIVLYSQGGFAEDWSQYARRLTGESDFVRHQALTQLREYSGLKNTLKRALQGSKRALALDVIAALPMKSLLPDLLLMAENDENGFIYLTVNTLLNSKNRNEIVTTYRKRLLCSRKCRASGPAQVVILDTLGRMGEDLSIEELKLIFSRSDWPEVKFAALNYIRLSLLQHHQEKYLPLIESALHSQPLQLREQALYLISELPTNLKKQSVTKLKNCQLALPPDTLEFCLNLKRDSS